MHLYNTSPPHLLFTALVTAWGSCVSVSSHVYFLGYIIGGLGMNYAYRARYQAFVFTGNMGSRQLGRVEGPKLVTTANSMGALWFRFMVWIHRMLFSSIFCGSFGL